MLPMRLLRGLAGQRRATGLALALTGGLVPGAVFASEPEPPSPLLPGSPQAAMLADLYWLIFWMAVVVFVLVEGLLLYSALRFRRQSDTDMPAQIHGNTRMEIAWTVAPALIVAAIFVLSLPGMGAVNAPPAAAVGSGRAVASAASSVCFVGDISAEEAEAFAGTSTLTVKVTGRQWWWQFEYPEYGFQTATDLHIPVGAIVKLELTSNDVIHSWWIPQLNGKQDVNPGQLTYSWFQAERPGIFEGQCAELCGDSHAYMPMRVIAVAPEEFQQWAQRQSQAAAIPADPLAQQGRILFEQKGCTACHTMSGVETPVVADPKAITYGPNLSNIGARTQIAGYLQNTPENLAQWLADPSQVKPGTRMPDLGLTTEEINALVAYLGSRK